MENIGCESLDADGHGAKRDGACKFTHLLHAHFSAHSARTVTSAYLHAGAHTRMAQVSEKVCCMRMSLISVSPSLSHVSPVSTVSVRRLSLDFPVRTGDADLTCPESAGNAHLRTSAVGFGYLAKSTHHTGYEPKEFDKITVDNLDLENISEFSRVTQESTGLTSVTTMCGPISVLQVSCVDFVLSNERMPRETVRRQREREEREGSVISIRSHSFQLHREFCSDGRDLREDLERRAQQLFLVKIQFREIKIQLSTTWRSQIWNEKIQNTHSESEMKNRLH